MRIEHDAGRASLLLLGLGLVTAAFFCFVLYPRLAGAYEASLDPDDYARIARNLWQGHGLSYDPSFGPMLYRGPGYPAFLASLLWVSDGAYPQAIWWAQSFLHGCTAVAVYWLGRETLGARVGWIAGGVAALYPALFWYVPRMWNDSALALLVTLTFLLAVRLARRPTWLESALLGGLLGVMCLTKGTFLPWIFVLPLGLAWRFRPSRTLWAVPLVALLFILPWSWRNHQIAGEWIPVHTGAMFNLVIGNELAEEFPNAPLAYDRLWTARIDSVVAMTDGLTTKGGLRDAQKEHIYRDVAKEQLQSPVLWAQKLLFGGTSFWYIGQSAAKTLVLFVLRAPALFLAPLGWWFYRRERGRRLELAVGLALLFWISHIPFAPPARLSLPLLPLQVLLAVFALHVLWERKQGRGVPPFPDAGEAGGAYSDPLGKEAEAS